MSKRFFARVFLIAFLAFFTSPIALHAADDDQAIQSLINLSLEDLDNVEVTSVSRKPESRFRAAAAVTVLSGDDIRRSGATNIAEALRLVPGINVARIDSNKWAITARGFNRQFSNKLLVLIDGRSVYTPLFSGVYWDVQDMVLADVDRVEVIRGPGATLWGANAVNGIINIITKSAEFTQGTHITSLYGNEEKGTFEGRYGGEAGENLFYRAYGKYLMKDESKTATAGGGTGDDWDQARAGFRADWNKSWNESFQFQGDIYTGHEEQTYFLPGLVTVGVSSPIDGDERVFGGNLLGSWTTRDKDGGETILKTYIDYISRDMRNVLDQNRLTFDIDFQQRRSLSERNEFVWGLGYRFFRDELKETTHPNGQQYLDYEPETSNNNLFSTFIQNEFSVLPDELFLTLGTKFSHNYFSEFEIQPNARLAWHASETQTFWGAVSRAIRIPTRGERGLSSIALSTPGGFVRQSANTLRNYDSEKLMAYELGHRIQPANWVSFDTSVFYHEYEDLRTFETGVSGFNLPGTAFELVASNSGFAESHGAEIAGSFSFTSDWKVFANYSFLELQTHKLKGSDDFLIAAKEGQSPEQQFTVSSRYNVTEDIELDNTLYYVDELPAYNIQDYFRFDTRIGWKPIDGVELSIVGQNLLNEYHQELRPSLYSRPADIGRSVYGKIVLNF